MSAGTSFVVGGVSCQGFVFVLLFLSLCTRLVIGFRELSVNIGPSCAGIGVFSVDMGVFCQEIVVSFHTVTGTLSIAANIL